MRGTGGACLPAAQQACDHGSNTVAAELLGWAGGGPPGLLGDSEEGGAGDPQVLIPAENVKASPACLGQVTRPSPAEAGTDLPYLAQCTTQNVNVCNPKLLTPKAPSLWQIASPRPETLPVKTPPPAYEKTAAPECPAERVPPSSLNADGGTGQGVCSR